MIRDEPRNLFNLWGHISRRELRRMGRRALVCLGLALLAAGFGVLNIHPDTPSEWLLLRICAGFALLLVGFACAVLPILRDLWGGKAE